MIGIYIIFRGIIKKLMNICGLIAILLKFGLFKNFNSYKLCLNALRKVMFNELENLSEENCMNLIL